MSQVARPVSSRARVRMQAAGPPHRSLHREPLRHRPPGQVRWGAVQTLRDEIVPYKHADVQFLRKIKTHSNAGLHAGVTVTGRTGVAAPSSAARARSPACRSPPAPPAPFCCGRRAAAVTQVIVSLPELGSRPCARISQFSEGGGPIESLREQETDAIVGTYSSRHASRGPSPGAWRVGERRQAPRMRSLLDGVLGDDSRGRPNSVCGGRGGDVHGTFLELRGVSRG